MTAEEIDEYSDDFGWFIDGFRGTIAEYVSKASALFGKIMHGEDCTINVEGTDGFVDENDFNEWIEDGAIGEDEWVEDDNPFEDMQKDNTDDTVDISQDNDFVAGFLRLLKSLPYIGYIDKVNKRIILNPLYVRQETGVSLAEINEQLEKMQGGNPGE